MISQVKKYKVVKVLDWRIIDNIKKQYEVDVLIKKEGKFEKITLPFDNIYEAQDYLAGGYVVFYLVDNIEETKKAIKEAVDEQRKGINKIQ